MLAPLTASQLALSLLHIADGTPVPVAVLIDVGQTVGVQPSALRVALTRLKKRGRVSNSDDGSWHLAAPSTPIARTIRAWRRGESRLRPWDGTWLAIHLPKRAASRTSRSRSVRALSRVGLREARPDLWVRPDCLAECMHPIATAEALGLEADAEPLWLTPREARAVQWQRTLWDTESLKASYRQMLAELSASAAREGDTPEFLAESLTLGRQVISALAFDPLLPAQIVDPSLRTELTQQMLTYDDAARTRWRRALARASNDLPGLTDGDATC